MISTRERLALYVVARQIAETARQRGSAGAAVVLQAPPLDLPARAWRIIAETILELKPRWERLTLLDVRRAELATVARGAVDQAA